MINCITYGGRMLAAQCKQLAIASYVCATIICAYAHKGTRTGPGRTGWFVEGMRRRAAPALVPQLPHTTPQCSTSPSNYRAEILPRTNREHCLLSGRIENMCLGGTRARISPVRAKMRRQRASHKYGTHCCFAVLPKCSRAENQG